MEARDVRSLADAFAWPRAYIESLDVELVRRLSSCCLDGINSQSSAFSGIGGFEVAMAQICAGLDAHLNLPGRHHVPSLHCIDCDYHNQCELMMMPSQSGCVFSDIIEFVNPAIRRNLLSRLSRLSFEDIVKVVFSPGALVLEAYCQRHMRTCRLQRAMIHAAGSPCPDWSALGLHRHAQGTDILCTLVWFALRLHLKEVFIIHENVPAFPVEWFDRFLGADYAVSSSVLSLASLGWPASRKRRFTVLCLKSKAA